MNREIKDIRKALDIKYRKFVKDFEDIGRRFKQAVIDADLTLQAIEEITEK